LKDLITRILSEEKGTVRLWVLLLGSLVIAITGWVFTADIWEAVDILFWDEVNYLNSGKQMFGKFNNQWGPAYAVWYKILSLFQQDTLDLYYLNYRMMAILPAIAMFWLLALSDVRRWIAFSVAMLFLFADINLPTWPKVSHYVVFAFLMGLSFMRYLPNILLKLGFMSLVSLYIAYARPEFYLTYMAVIVLSILAFFVDSSSRKLKFLAPALLMILLSFSIQLVIGNPMFNFQGDRSALAFAQHFMFNYFQWNDIDQDFWITWMSYYEKEFGSAGSLKEAYALNPELFKQHLLSNIQGYIVNGFRKFSDVMLPEQLVALPLTARMAVLVLGGAISITLMGRSAFVETVWNSLRKNMLVVVLLLIFVAPSLLASIVIYPRDHYMFLHVPVVILLACLLFFSQPMGIAMNPWKNIAPAALAIIAAWIWMPSLKNYDYFDLWRKENSLANLKTVEKLRAYNFSAPVRLLENEGGINQFLSDNYSWIRGFMKDRPWVEYIEAEHVNVIYVTPSLEKYPSLLEDETYPVFRDHPEQYGFIKVSTGPHEPYLLIKENLLKSLEI
jgi:hypothetical protein